MEADAQMEEELTFCLCADSSVGITVGCGLDDGVLFLAGMRDFCLLHGVQIGSEAYLASYTIGDSFLWCKAALTDHLHLLPRSRMVELYINSS
jgi:hypothetical protein